MSDSQQPKSYRVVLKTGEHSIFTNQNNFENYPARLVSGIYGITTRTGNTPITSESVESITEVLTTTCSECKGESEVHPGSNICSHCGERIIIPATEH